MRGGLLVSSNWSSSYLFLHQYCQVIKHLVKFLQTLRDSHQLTVTIHTCIQEVACNSVETCINENYLTLIFCSISKISRCLASISLSASLFSEVSIYVYIADNLLARALDYNLSSLVPRPLPDFISRLLAWWWGYNLSWCHEINFHTVIRNHINSHHINLSQCQTFMRLGDHWSCH